MFSVLAALGAGGLSTCDLYCFFCVAFIFWLLLLNRHFRPAIFDRTFSNDRFHRPCIRAILVTRYTRKQVRHPSQDIHSITNGIVDDGGTFRGFPWGVRAAVWPTRKNLSPSAPEPRQSNHSPRAASAFMK